MDNAPRFAPNNAPTKITPTVWPVIGTGLNGKGIEICANMAINKEPSIIKNIFVVLSLSERTP